MWTIEKMQTETQPILILYTKTAAISERMGGDKNWKERSMKCLYQLNWKTIEVQCREAEVQRREAEVQCREAEVQRREAEVQRRKAEVQCRVGVKAGCNGKGRYGW